MPYLQVLSEFREGVRRVAREHRGEAVTRSVAWARLAGPLLHVVLGVVGDEQHPWPLITRSRDTPRPSQVLVATHTSRCQVPLRSGQPSRAWGHCEGPAFPHLFCLW